MHNRICSVCVSLCSLSLALSLQAQLVQTRGVGSQSPVHPTSQPFVMVPFAAEYKVTTVRTKADGTSMSQEEIEGNTHDSHGRMSVASTQVSTGITYYRINDPVAGTRIDWNTANRTAILLNLPQAVPGRMSCWKMAPEESEAARGDGQLGVSAIQCPPAESAGFSISCKGTHSSATSTSEELPAINAGYPTCADVSQEKSVEDLGTQRVQGFEAQGCRTTKTVPRGASINETWWIELRMGTIQVRLPVRSLDEEPIFRDQSFKQTRELTFLRLNEPDLKTFQPPEGYEIKTLEMHEVPCEQRIPSN
jgi:hypothetical protein